MPEPDLAAHQLQASIGTCTPQQNTLSKGSNAATYHQVLAQGS